MNIKTRVTYQWCVRTLPKLIEVDSGEFHHTLDLGNHNDHEKGKRTAKKQARQRFGSASERSFTVSCGKWVEDPLYVNTWKTYIYIDRKPLYLLNLKVKDGDIDTV